MRVAQNTDYLSLGGFILEVRLRAPRDTLFVPEAEHRNPFFALTERMCDAPDTLEHQVLVRVLRAMVNEPMKDHAFARSDVAALSPDLLVLLSEFVDDFHSGRYEKVAMSARLAVYRYANKTKK